MQIKIASPCPARWQDMDGDERSRYCQQCRKQVYNFTKMSQPEILALIQEKEGDVCARMYQRGDGTILLEDCPRGLARAYRRVSTLVSSSFALLFGILALSVQKVAGQGSNNNPNHPITRKIDDAVQVTKRWLGMNPPVYAGKICIVPPTNSVKVIPKTNAPAVKMGEVCIVPPSTNAPIKK